MSTIRKKVETSQTHESYSSLTLEALSQYPSKLYSSNNHYNNNNSSNRLKKALFIFFPPFSFLFEVPNQKTLLRNKTEPYWSKFFYLKSHYTPQKHTGLFIYRREMVQCVYLVRDEIDEKLCVGIDGLRFR